MIRQDDSLGEGRPVYVCAEKDQIHNSVPTYNDHLIATHLLITSSADL